MVRSRGEKIPFKFGGRRYRFRLLGSAKTREEKIRVFSGGGKFTRRPVHCDVEYDRWNATRKEWAPMSLSVTKKKYRDDVKVRFQGHLVSLHSLVYYIWGLKGRGLSARQMAQEIEGSGFEEFRTKSLMNTVDVHHSSGTNTAARASLVLVPASVNRARSRSEVSDHAIRKVLRFLRREKRDEDRREGRGAWATSVFFSASFARRMLSR